MAKKMLSITTGTITGERTERHIPKSRVVEVRPTTGLEAAGLHSIVMLRQPEERWHCIEAAQTIVDQLNEE